MTDCNCGSGLPKFPLYDARNIFCTIFCEQCEAEKRRGFRLEIFEDPNYEHNKPIEEDE